MPVVVAACIALAFYRGFHMPSIWSGNYYLLATQDGFWRRSLIGTLLYSLGDARFHYHVIASVQLAVTAVLTVILFARTALASIGRQVLVAVFFATQLGAYYFYTVGYPEHLLFLLLLACLAARGPLVPALVAAASVLVHEAAVLFTLPFLVLVQWERGERKAMAATIASALLAFAFISLHQTVPDATIDAFKAKLFAKADYGVRQDYFEIFSESWTGRRFHNHYQWKDAAEDAGALALAAVACAAVFPSLRRRGRPWLAAGCGAAILSPLALGFFGWDVYRWVFLSAAIATCVVLRYAGRGGGFVMGLALIAFSSFTTLRYFFDDAPRTPEPSAIAHFVTVDLREIWGATPIR